MWESEKNASVMQCVMNRVFNNRTLRYFEGLDQMGGELNDKVIYIMARVV